jgi:sugar lactone lactonase YvrE
MTAKRILNNGVGTVLLLALGAVAAVAGDRVYWTDTGARRIESADLTGLNRVTVVRDVAASGIAVDAVGRRIYWTELSPPRVRSADLEGGDIRDLVTAGLVDPDDIELDLAAGKMYWSEPTASRILRADLDGSNVETVVVANALFPTGLALNPSAGMVYWTDPVNGLVARTPIGTGEFETLVGGVFDVFDVELDLAEQAMFFTEPGPSRIQRTDLEGGGATTVFIANAIAPAGLALHPEQRMLFWTDSRTLRIFFSSYAPFQFVEQIVDSGLIEPRRIDLLLDAGGCDPCDVNCDGVVDAFDIEPFIGLLTGGGSPCAPCAGDANGDGTVDAFDIEPFIDCLSG